MTVSVVPSIVGAFNTVFANSTLRARVTLTDTQMNLFTKAGTYRWSWKRTDDGFEDILLFGDFIVEKATAP